MSNVLQLMALHHNHSNIYTCFITSKFCEDHINYVSLFQANSAFWLQVPIVTITELDPKNPFPSLPIIIIIINNCGTSLRHHHDSYTEFKSIVIP